MLRNIRQRYKIIVEKLFILYRYYLLGGNKMPNVNGLLDIVKSKMKSLNLGKIFLLGDLFKGYEWNSITRSDRLLLGTLFLIYCRLRWLLLKRLLQVSRSIENRLICLKVIKEVIHL